MSAFVASLIRTYAPLIAAWILSLPITPWVLDVLGVTPEQAGAKLVTFIGLVLAGVWYLVARLLEHRVRPWLVKLGGWMLLSRLQPTYAPQAPDGTYDITNKQ